jgi:hypothetical protein
MFSASCQLRSAMTVHTGLCQDWNTATEIWCVCSLDSWTEHLCSIFIKQPGPGSSVGIATGYGMDGPGIESRWERDFPHLSRQAL